MRPSATAKHYYNSHPSGDHATGDIWANLPSHGLLRETFVPGLVITPACDLAQSKVETITYLPIVEVHEWFGSSSFRAEVMCRRGSQACSVSPARSFTLEVLLRRGSLKGGDGWTAESHSPGGRCPIEPLVRKLADSTLAS